MKNLYLVLMVLCAALLLSTPGITHTYSHNAWVGMTGARTLAVNPFYNIDLSAPYGSTFLAKFDYGFTDQADIFIDVTSRWIMPRYDLSGNNLLIAGLYLPTGSGPGIQLHGIYDEMENFAIEYNLALSTAAWDFSSPDLKLIVAPTLKLGDFGIWVEADLNSIISSFDFDMGAGIYINAGDNQISLGVNNILARGGSRNIGAWLWAPFTFQ